MQVGTETLSTYFSNPTTSMLAGASQAHRTEGLFMNPVVRILSTLTISLIGISCNKSQPSEEKAAAPQAEVQSAAPPTAAASVPAAPVAAPTGPALRIAYSEWPGWVAWEIAIQKGWFRDAGLNVEFKWFE